MDLLLWWILLIAAAGILYKIGMNWETFTSNPFKFRPKQAEDDVLTWENNWVSNAMAWFSQVFLRKWCDDEEHWTFRVVNYLFAECSCCLSWRFFWLGMIFGITVASIGAALI